MKKRNAKFYGFIVSCALLVLVAVLVSGYLVYRSNTLWVKSGWNYEVLSSGYLDLSGLTHDEDGNLLITEESQFSEGRVIWLDKDGSRKTLYVGLDEPDVVRAYKGKLMVSEEQGVNGLSLVDHGVKSQIFSANALEGFDINDDGNLVYAVEDTKSGRLLRYDFSNRTLNTLVSGLNEAEGVCVGEKYIYYTEKKGNTFNRIGFMGGNPEVLSRELSKPSAVHCDNKKGVVWIAEERRNLGRLLRFDGKDMEVVARFLGEPQEIASQGDAILISDQRRGTIFKIFPDK